MPGSSRRAHAVALAAAAVLLSGCYHSIITTELAPSSEVHHEPWKPAFIAGLVPAQVDGSSYCQGRRWARVETQQSFLNWVVAAVTFGIFTPMDIRVWCAGAGARAEGPAAPTIRVGAGDPAAARRLALDWASKFAREGGTPVYVAF